MGEQASVIRPAGGEGDSGGGRSLLGRPDAPSDNRIPIRPSSGYQPLTPGRDAVLAPGSPMARPRTDDLGPLSTMSGTPRAGATPGSGTETPAREGDETAGPGAKAKNRTVTANAKTNTISI